MSKDWENKDNKPWENKDGQSTNKNQSWDNKDKSNMSGNKDMSCDQKANMGAKNCSEKHSGKSCECGCSHTEKCHCKHM